MSRKRFGSRFAIVFSFVGFASCRVEKIGPFLSEANTDH